MNTHASDKSAKIVRIISAPPFVAALFVLLLYYSPNHILTEKNQLIAMLVCLSAVPLAAYPISAILKMNRSQQRILAMAISFAAYLVLATLSITLKWSFKAELISLTYFISSLWLIVFNKLFKLRASGHACAVTGPGVMMCALLDVRYFPACALFYVVVLWASLKTKRHSVKEYLLGVYVLFWLMFWHLSFSRFEDSL